LNPPESRSTLLTEPPVEPWVDDDALRAPAPVAGSRLRRSVTGLAGRRDAARVLLMAADAAAVAVAFGIGLQFVHGAVLRPESILAIPAIVLMARLLGMYSREGGGLSWSTLNEFPQHFQLVTLLALLASLLGDRLVEPGWSAGTTVALWVSLLVVLPLARAIVRIVPAKVAPERCLVVGDPGRASRVRRTIEGLSAGRRRAVIAWVAPDQLTEPDSYEVLGELAKHHGIDHVVLAPAVIDTVEVVGLMRYLEGLDVRVTLMPRLMEVASATIASDGLGTAVGLEVRRLGLSRTQRILKRGFDLVVALALLALAAPLLVTIALVIRLTGGGGPVLFRQQRIGREGKAFSMLKFRTMVADADARKVELLAQNQADGLFKMHDDPRITRVGRILRKASLDELPQLINVLRGEMSLVGPRPLVPEEDSTIAGWHRRRLTAVPGMTGVWQVMGSARIPLHEMVELDNLYLVSWSPWLDLKILVRTAIFVLARRGI
jgi:exopolysaccharide biosynthesis polyprenyl glycosylphosphotransferase